MKVIRQLSAQFPKDLGVKGEGILQKTYTLWQSHRASSPPLRFFAEKASLVFNEIHADAKLTIDRNEQGVPELQKVDLVFTLTGVTDQEKAQTILAESEKYCLVGNATKSVKTFTYKI